MARGRGELEAVLGAIQAKTLVLGIDSDILFPPHEQEFLSKHIPNSSCEIIPSLYGHDGFLIEVEQVKSKISAFISHAYSRI